MIKALLKTIAFVLTIGAVISAFYFTRINEKGKADAIKLTEITSSAHIYKLSVYEGRIALFKAGFAMPIEIYDVYIDNLPTNEKVAIENGINANSDEEIRKIIEDYTS
ncbi:MAG: hypothetical protein RR355_05245 [Oscillospiraceae bacterium]